MLYFFIFTISTFTKRSRHIDTFGSKLIICIPSLSCETVRQCQQLLTIAKDAFLNQMVDKPTMITETKSSIQDLSLTDNDTLVNKTGVIPRISDLKAVFMESSLRPTKKSPTPRRVYKYHPADYEGFKKEFLEFTRDINEQATEMDSQTIWTSFKTTIHRLMEKLHPTQDSTW